MTIATLELALPRTSYQSCPAVCSTFASGSSEQIKIFPRHYNWTGNAATVSLFGDLDCF